MTRPNLALIPVADLQGAIPGNKVGLHTRPSSDPAVVTCAIPWANYGVSDTKQQLGVVINVGQTTQQTTGQLDAIRSIKIDNSYCPVPIYVQFFDTGDVVTCPAYSIVQTPVLTNSLICKVYGDGFFTGRPPTTTISFFNGLLEPLFIPGTLIDAVKERYAGSPGIQGLIGATATWPALNSAAPPAVDRILCAMFVTVGNVAGAYTTSSATINGIPLLLAVQISFVVGGITYNVAIYYQIIPTGTALTASVTYNNAAPAKTATCMIGGIYNWTNAIPNTGFGLAPATSVASMNINTVPGASGFFCCADANNDGLANYSVGDLMAIISVNSAAPLLEASAAHETFLTADFNNVNIQGNIIAGAVWV